LRKWRFGGPHEKKKRKMAILIQTIDFLSTFKYKVHCIGFQNNTNFSPKTLENSYKT
jgi:hypothetical protein